MPRALPARELIPKGVVSAPVVMLAEELMKPVCLRGRKYLDQLCDRSAHYVLRA